VSFHGVAGKWRRGHVRRAAHRAIKAAATAPTFAGTVTTATTARRLLANEDAMLYDNPHALLTSATGPFAIATASRTPRASIWLRQHRPH
jgi:hypothetical protein